MKNYRSVSGDGSAPAVLNPDSQSGFTTPGKKVRTTVVQSLSRARPTYCVCLLRVCCRAFQAFLGLSSAALCLLKYPQHFRSNLKCLAPYQGLTKNFTFQTEMAGMKLSPLARRPRTQGLPLKTSLWLLLICHWALLFRLSAASPTESALDHDFASTIHPFLETYCFGCHGKEKQKAKLDLSVYTSTQSVAEDYRRWEMILEKLKANEMPPEEAKQHPTPELRDSVINWITAFRKFEADRNAGDPGPVLAHRLSNAEYDYTIRDLTGVDIRPTKEFPVDPANEAGFDNSGESLAMSPALLKKYLEAAQRVAQHVVLKPQGFVFSPYPMVADPDRDKYCVQRVVEFYQRQPTNYVDYFMAAWRFKNKAALGKAQGTLADFAAAAKISPKYLAKIWTILEEEEQNLGPLLTLQSLWRELPPAGKTTPESVRRSCEKMRDLVVAARQKLVPKFKYPAIKGISNGSQSFVLWMNRQRAQNRMRYIPESKTQTAAETSPETEKLIAEEALTAPTNEADRPAYEQALSRFCSIFPDAFYISARGRYFVDPGDHDEGRLLSAGFHLMTGYFRDDQPLYDLILNPEQQHEIDSLWQELNFITYAPLRQYRDFIFFERAEPPRFMQGAEFDFARSEDKDVTSSSKIQQLSQPYLAKARRAGGEGTAIEAIEQYFKEISAQIQWVETNRLAAEENHLKTLLDFAQRAYRRPLSQSERDDLLAFYHSLRKDEGLDHEEAMRDSITSILVSPDFCYQFGVADPNRSAGILPAGSGASSLGTSPHRILPLSDYSLASRLSYFLWSTMPDRELLDHATADDLHKPEILLAQTRRMLHDHRVGGLITEFGANWLDFRRFEEHNSVDRKRFKSFNNDLREAMFEEPIHFFLDLVQQDRSVLNFLYADYTFVNPILAAHYKIPASSLASNQWLRVENASQYARGGLLPMSVFLTKNSPGLRTSPVKRGYWVVRRLLGEVIPPPPPKVPELPSDEAKLDLPLRETLARHRSDKACSGCHARFDSFGLVFENYGPIGELREKDLAGRDADIRASFPGGSEGAGLNGLRQYIREHRQDDFLDNLCRKMLAYALGRTLMLSDDGTIEQMRAKLAANDFRFSALVETIVASPQFLNTRVDMAQASRLPVQGVSGSD